MPLDIVASYFGTTRALIGTVTRTWLAAGQGAG
jgi:putative transposase